jgi:hypothetical protein
MESLYNSIFYSYGILFWTGIVFLVLAVFNLANVKGIKDVLQISLIVVVVSGIWHFYNKNNLRIFLQGQTCSKMEIDKRLDCKAIQERDFVTISVHEKDSTIRFEKFYRENEYQINRQVSFRIKETCSFYAFCKYDYERMNQEFILKKDRVQMYLTQDLNRRIYFE